MCMHFEETGADFNRLQDYVLNLIFSVACAVPTSWPLAIRRIAGRVYHHGGAHSGSAISAVVWLVYFSQFLSKPLLPLSVC